MSDTQQKWQETVSKAEQEWHTDKNKALNPFNLKEYVKAAEKYQETMRKATFEALKEPTT